MAVGDWTDDGGLVVAEVFADADGLPCEPELATTIEVTVAYPDGSEQRTYLSRSS